MKKKVLLSIALLSAIMVSSTSVTANAAGAKFVQVQTGAGYHILAGQPLDCLQQIVIKHGIIIGNLCQKPTTPEEEAPDTSIPDTGVSDTEKPGIETPAPETPDAGKPDIETPVPETPDTGKPDIETPDTEIPDTDVSETPDSSNTQSPGIQKPGTDETDKDTLSYAEQVVKLVNEERAKAGLPALQMQTSITAAANVRAMEIKKLFSHTRPDGSNFSSALSVQGVSYRGCGENIAYGQKSPEAVMEGWINSSGHRANILNKNYKNIGVGYYQDERGVKYWVQLFTY